MEAIIVGIGGFFGAIARWLTYKLVHGLVPFDWVPVGTFTVNIFGSFLLSWLLFSNWNHPFLDSKGMLFLGTGFMGAFTTFSTFSFETMQLLEKSKILAVLYAFGMLIFCLISAFLGYKYAR